MADDLANNWGCTLIHPTDTSRRSQQFAQGYSFKRLQEAIRKTTKGRFLLTKVCGCGSDANLFASMESAIGDTSRISIAAGSYVAGDGSVLQSWSSSCFDCTAAFAVVQLPEDIDTGFTIDRTMALPYRVPCGYCQSETNSTIGDKYEDDVLHALHVRLLFANLIGRPFSSLLLELILGGNGAALSARALCKLAQILSHHDMRCVVDECLTGARCGPDMLVTQSTPLAFQEVVSHVTCAKWLGIGIVLVNASFKQKEQHIDRIGPPKRGVRGQSTEVDCHKATQMWQEVENKLSTIPDRRQQVQNALKLDGNMCWGEGLLMFGPKMRRDSKGALKNRYLPLLMPAKVDAIPFHPQLDWHRKEAVCEGIMTSVKYWVDQYAFIARMIAEDLHGTSNGFAWWWLCVELAKPHWKEEPFFRLEDMMTALKGNNVNEEDLKVAMKAAVHSRLISPHQKGRKRVRGYQVMPICNPIGPLI